MLINYVNIYLVNHDIYTRINFKYIIFLGVSLFDYSGTQMDKKNQKILSYCLSQMQCVKNFLDYLCSTYGAHIINGNSNSNIFFYSVVIKKLYIFENILHFT